MDPLNPQLLEIQDHPNLDPQERELFLNDIFRTEELTKGENHAEKTWNEN